MYNALSIDRFPAFNFQFLDHFSLQVKCFDGTPFYFGDWCKLILGSFCFCRFYFFLWRDKIFKIAAQKPQTCKIPWEQTKSVTEIIKNLTVYIDWETLPEN